MHIFMKLAALKLKWYSLSSHSDHPQNKFAQCHLIVPHSIFRQPSKCKGGAHVLMRSLQGSDKDKHHPRSIHLSYQSPDRKGRESPLYKDRTKMTNFVTSPTSTGQKQV